MFRKIKSLWYERCRGIDLDILWPTLCEEARIHAPDNALAVAKAALALHCYNDPAWLFLGRDTIYTIIDKLEEA